MYQLVRKMRSIALLLMIMLVGGCDSSEHSQSTSPTSANENVSSFIPSVVSRRMKEYFLYEKGETPGITIHADLTKYHREDQPYGVWVVNATWREQQRRVVVEENQMLQVSTEGMGTAHLSADFLAAVFAEARRQYVEENKKTNVWHDQPGLYLNIYPDEHTATTYYTFEGGKLSGWNFGGSLVTLVDSIEGFVWWPGMEAPTASKAAADVRGLLEVKTQTVPAVLVNIAEPYQMVQTSGGATTPSVPPCTKSVTLPGGADGVKFFVDTSGCLTGTAPYFGAGDWIQRQDANASTVTNVSCTCASGGPVGATNLPTSTPTDCSVTPGNDAPCQKMVGTVNGCGLPATCTW